MGFKEQFIAQDLLSFKNTFVIKRKNHDVLDQAESLPFWNQEYVQLDKGSFAGTLTSASYEDIQIFTEKMNKGVDQIALAPKNTYVFGLPTVIFGKASWGSLPTNAQSLISLNKNTELTFRTSGRSEITAAVISAAKIEHFADQHYDVDFADLIKRLRPVELITPEQYTILLQSMTELSSYMQQANSATANSVNSISDHWSDHEYELLSNCLDMLISLNLKPAKQIDQRVHRHIVSRVRDITLQHHSFTLSIEQICSELHLSRRTLTHAFSRILGITPVEYIRNLRLHRVRSELKAMKDDKSTIADIASKWGFWHRSLFTRYYKELFGECPSETTARNSTKNKKIFFRHN